MKAHLLKNSIFFIMFFAKFWLILLILFHYETKGLQESEVYSIIALIIPVFITYVTLMMEDLLSKPYESTAHVKKVKHIKVPIVIITFISLPVYILSMSLIIILAAQGKIESTKLQMYVGGVEAGFGIYVAKIISTLFIEKR